MVGALDDEEDEEVRVAMRGYSCMDESAKEGTTKETMKESDDVVIR